MVSSMTNLNQELFPWTLHELSNGEVKSFTEGLVEDPDPIRGELSGFCAYSEFLTEQGLDIYWPVDEDILPEVYWNQRELLTLEQLILPDDTLVKAGARLVLITRMDTALPFHHLLVEKP